MLAKQLTEVFNKSMSEHASQSSDETAIFNEIMQASRLRDEGIERIDGKMSVIKKQLLEVYGGERRSNDLDGALQEVREMYQNVWEHSEDIATVSGKLRLYSFGRILDEDDVRRAISDIAMKDDDGEVMRFDQNGSLYFTVDDTRLVSKGTAVEPLYDEEGVLQDIRIGYVFKKVDDESPMQLFAEPSELLDHSYDTPTFAEVERRLAHDYPTEYAELQRLIRPGLDGDLPASLVGIEDSMQALMLKDRHFVQLLEVYCENILQLHEREPYRIVVKGKIDCFDIESRINGEWTTLEINGSLLVEASEVRVLFEMSADRSAVQARLLTETYNDEFGYTPEMVGILVRDIALFGSRKAQRSLVSRALNRGLLSNEDTPGEEGEGMLMVPAHENLPNYVREQIESLMALRDALDKVRKKVDIYRKNPLATKEEALDISERITASLLKETYPSGASILLERLAVEAQGTAVYRAYPPRSEDEAESDPLNRVRGLVDGEFVRGRVDRVYPYFEEIYQDDEVRYAPQPTIMIRTAIRELSDESIQIDGGLDLMTVAETYLAAVPLHSDTSLLLVDLDEYEARRDAYGAIEQVYADSPMLAVLKDLDGQLSAEQSHEYTPLDITLFARISQAMQELMAQKKSIKPAMNFLDMSLLKRAVVMRDTEQDELYGVTIIDITNDKQTVTLLGQDKKDESRLRRVPITAITEFRY